MESPHNSSRRPFLWIWAAMFALAGLGTWFATMNSTTPTAPRRVVVAVDTNGVPRLLGISMANTNLRDGVFQAMGTAGLKASTKMPPGLSNTNQAAVSNFIETLKSMDRAGLFPTNSSPNPYE